VVAGVVEVVWCTVRCMCCCVGVVVVVVVRGNVLGLCTWLWCDGGGCGMVVVLCFMVVVCGSCLCVMVMFVLFVVDVVVWSVRVAGWGQGLCCRYRCGHD
jgi:hypothetical protein